MKEKRLIFLVLSILVIFSFSCATKKPPDPSSIIAPEPIPNNSGKYLCPYTSDGVLAEWVDKALYVGVARELGGVAGAYIGQRVTEEIFENVPFIGGYLGQKAGESVGRKIAIKACGGWDYIRSTSDLSFNNIDDLAVWLYVYHSQDENYQDVLKLMMDIYPELENRYTTAIYNAQRK